ncbi:MAG: hypothetical protein ACWA5T_09325 [Parvularcula sp.]
MTQAELKKKTNRQRFRPPHLTATGVRVILQYLALPILLALTVIDFGLYLVFRFGFDRCYGVLCLLG